MNPACRSIEDGWTGLPCESQSRGTMTLVKTLAFTSCTRSTSRRRFTGFTPYPDGSCQITERARHDSHIAGGIGSEATRLGVPVALPARGLIHDRESILKNLRVKILEKGRYLGLQTFKE